MVGSSCYFPHIPDSSKASIISGLATPNGDVNEVFHWQSQSADIFYPNSQMHTVAKRQHYSKSTPTVIVQWRLKRVSTNIKSGKYLGGRSNWQYAKMNHPHLKTIASAGMQPKLDFMKSIGADVIFNYKTENFATVLAEHRSIDILYYRCWDMTAGLILDAAVANMHDFRLIVACSVTSIDTPIKNRRSITVRGLRFTDFMEQYLMQFLVEVPVLTKSDVNSGAWLAWLRLRRTPSIFVLAY